MTAVAANAAAIERRRPSRALRRLLRRRGAVVAGVVVLLFIAIAVVAPIVAPYDPLAPNYLLVRKAPSLVHWMGTDELGRDVFSRVIWGARASLLAGLISVALSVAFGVPI